MPINVVEIHHHGIRIDGDAAGLAANLEFYQGLLGLIPDRGLPDFPGIPGFWMNVGETGQIHLFGGELPSPLAKGADQDPASPHLALAVADILEAKAELDRRGTPYWSLTRGSGAAGATIVRARPLRQHDRITSSRAVPLPRC